MVDEQQTTGNVNISDINADEVNIGPIVTGHVEGDVVGGDKITIRQKIINLFTGTPDQQHELRNREAMLLRVHDFWVKGVLENSLYNEVLIELGLEEKREAVEYPWKMVLQRPNQPNHSLPSTTKIIDVYDETGGSLLILGEPGSGKTTMLLELARRTIARARANPTEPMPVVFNLSSWAEMQLPLAQWLVAELNTKYNISRKLAERWVNEDDLLVLLDGLDEVAHKHREACARAINQFYQDQMSRVVVCSRLADYEALATKLRLPQSVVLQPLSLEQIKTYLNRITSEPSPLWPAIQNDARLHELARSPLMLNIMALVFQKIPVNAFQLPTSIDQYKKQVFDAYVHLMFGRRGPDQRYSSEQTIRWLSWLAKRMKQHNETTFFIEQMQASWLATPQQQKLYAISLRLIGAMIFFVVGGLSAFLAGKWFSLMNSSDQTVTLDHILITGFGAGFAFTLSSIVATRRWMVLLVILVTGIILTLTRIHEPVTAFIGAVIFGAPAAIAGLPLARRRIIQFNDSFTWTRRRVVFGILGGLATGLIAGVISPDDKLMDTLEIGLPVGLILGLIFGLKRVELIHTRTKPNQGLHRSIQNAFRIGIMAFLMIFLFGGLIGVVQDGFVLGMTLAILVAGTISVATGLYFGGNAGLQHGLLRIMLYWNKEVPLKLVDFLNYGVDRIFLRNVGHGYIFIHQWLLDHFLTLNESEQL